MKKLLTTALLLTLLVPLAAFGQKTQWSFVKAFPDTNFKTSIHGLALDGAGRLWVLPYYGQPGDSVFDVVRGANRLTRAVRVYSMDGTLVQKIQIMQGAGVNDTLYFAGLGLCAGPTGDVYVSTGTSTLGATNYVYKVNYQTYQVIGRIAAVNTAGANNSETGVAVDSLDEVYVGTVYPGNPIKMFDGKTFTLLGNAVDTAYGYGRTVAVSKDGNDVYITRYTTNTVRWHCDLGSIGPYVFADTVLSGLRVESSAWNSRDGCLYLSSGSVGGGYPPSAGYREQTWYAFDPVTKTVKDSLIWNSALSPGDCRPRAITFSRTGDTAFVGQFNASVACIQVFRRTIVSVEPVDIGIPSGYTLSQNYPNPFNPTTEIQFSIVKGGFTTLKVYDLLGKEVATLVNEHLNPGTFKSTLNGTNLSSGTYIYRLVSGTSVITKKMMLLK